MRYLLLFIVVIACYACQKQDLVIKQAYEISHAIASQTAPDKREAIYEVSFQMLPDKKILVTGETSLPGAKKLLKAALEAKKLQWVDSLKLLPSSRLGNKNWGIVNLSVINLRAKPSHTAEMVSQAILGTPLRVLKEQNGWYLVQVPDNYIAWVDNAAISVKEIHEMKTWRKSPKVIFLPSFGMAFNPETGHVVTDLVAGSILQVQSEGHNYFNLVMPDGRQLRVNKTFCMNFETWKEKPVPAAQELIKTAKLFMGRPYLWGGTSGKGVDCSGFVKTVYFLNGIILARDASQQFQYGDTIAPQQGWENLETGDLIFFGYPATGKKLAKIIHVGMYTGNGEFIHSSGRVEMDNMNPEIGKYVNHKGIAWLGGRRLLPQIGKKGIVKVENHPWY